ncbi:MAG: hypothetical protein CMB31_01500 [Euryarchaeota archaeon]|nr:hypothetical protein [Euryarchaeota archaeon]
MEVHTGCCQAENDIMGFANCLPPNGGKCNDGRDGGNIVDENGNIVTDEDDETKETAEENKFLLTTALEKLSERVTKASDVALASKMAYPTDFAIVTKSDQIIEEVEKHQLDINNIQTDITSLDLSTSFDEIDGKIATLAGKINTTERISQEVVMIISNNYIAGFQKMYVFGGIGLLVLLIILIVIMKKK